MLGEPPAVDVAIIDAELRDGWGIDSTELSYFQVGFGSFHWMAVDATGGRWFVTADAPSSVSAADDLRGALTGAALLAAEHPFVFAPERDMRGHAVREAGGGWLLTVRPFVDAEASDFGVWRSADRRRIVLRALRQLHESTGAARSSLPVDDFSLGVRPELEAALDDLGGPWCGPFGEPTRKLLGQHASEVVALLEHYDDLAREVAASTDRVCTHGEPHAANVLWQGEKPLFVDWDTARLAPCERDLWMVLTDDADDLASYNDGFKPLVPDPVALRLYDAQWVLTEIGGYADRFRREHGRTRDDEVSWEALGQYLPLAPKWRGSLGGWR